jgi:hypothetical protein
VSFDQLVELFQNGTMNSWSGFGKKLLLEIEDLIQKVLPYNSSFSSKSLFVTGVSVFRNSYK